MRYLTDIAALLLAILGTAIAVFCFGYALWCAYRLWLMI
jgi:hypothetical protein